jgi:hypothetical protein
MRYFIIYYETISDNQFGQTLNKGTLTLSTEGYPNKIKTEQMIKDLDKTSEVVKVVMPNTVELSQSDYEDWIYDPDSKEKTPLQILKEIEKVDLVLKRRDQLQDFVDKYISLDDTKDKLVTDYIKNSKRLSEDVISLDSNPF